MNDMIQTVVTDPGVRNGILFASAAVGGQVLHIIKKWAQGEGNMFTNPKRAVAAAIGNLTAIFTAMLVGVDNLTLSQALITGMLTGLGANSMLFKGERAEWTPNERKANNLKP